MTGIYRIGLCPISKRMCYVCHWFLEEKKTGSTSMVDLTNGGTRYLVHLGEGIGGAFITDVFAAVFASGYLGLGLTITSRHERRGGGGGMTNCDLFLMGAGCRIPPDTGTSAVEPAATSFVSSSSLSSMWFCVGEKILGAGLKLRGNGVESTGGGRKPSTTLVVSFSPPSKVGYAPTPFKLSKLDMLLLLT